MPCSFFQVLWSHCVSTYKNWQNTKSSHSSPLSNGELEYFFSIGSGAATSTTVSPQLHPCSRRPCNWRPEGK
jgi:hypothetical protein